MLEQSYLISIEEIDEVLSSFWATVAEGIEMVDFDSCHFVTECYL